MTVRIGALDDKRAVAAASRVVDKWYKKNGVEAAADVETVRAAAEIQDITIPTILCVQKSQEILPEQGELARNILLGLAEAKSSEIRDWTRESIEHFGGATRAHVDPLTIGIGTTVMFSALVLVSKLHTDSGGKLRLDKLKKGDIAAIAALVGTVLAFASS